MGRMRLAEELGYAAILPAPNPRKDTDIEDITMATVKRGTLRRLAINAGLIESSIDTIRMPADKLIEVLQDDFDGIGDMSEEEVVELLDSVSDDEKPVAAKKGKPAAVKKGKPAASGDEASAGDLQSILESGDRGLIIAALEDAGVPAKARARISTLTTLMEELIAKAPNDDDDDDDDGEPEEAEEAKPSTSGRRRRGKAGAKQEEAKPATATGGGRRRRGKTEEPPEDPKDDEPGSDEPDNSGVDLSEVLEAIAGLSNELGELRTELGARSAELAEDVLSISDRIDSMGEALTDMYLDDTQEGVEHVFDMKPDEDGEDEGK